MAVKHYAIPLTGGMIKTVYNKWNSVSQIDLHLERNSKNVVCVDAMGQAAYLYGCDSDTDNGTAIGLLSKGAQYDVSGYKYIRIFANYNAQSNPSALKITY